MTGSHRRHVGPDHHRHGLHPEHPAAMHRPPPIARIALGVAEAGLYPGLLLYLTFSLRTRDRSQGISSFSLAQPFALLIGSTIAGLILDHIDWFGLNSWRWVLSAKAFRRSSSVSESCSTSLIGPVAPGGWTTRSRHGSRARPARSTTRRTAITTDLAGRDARIRRSERTCRIC
jgi:MFS family permease